jgi:hypothetical protein
MSVSRSIRGGASPRSRKGRIRAGIVSSCSEMVAKAPAGRLEARSSRRRLLAVVAQALRVVVAQPAEDDQVAVGAGAELGAATYALAGEAGLLEGARLGDVIDVS